MKVLLVDINKCNGCYNCQIACKDEHVGNAWPPVAKPQPDTGHFWLKVTDVVQGSVPKVRVRYTIELCQHCGEAPCLTACKAGAIYRRADGIVVIDPERCTGSRNCLYTCPYGAVYFNAGLNIAQKCTMCAHLLDQGWKEPRCVDACPTGALTFGEETDLAPLLAGAEPLKPALGTRPRVYYKGWPDRFFVAGAVYDPDADEVLMGARVELTNQATGATAAATTDLFGDFWFERQEPGTYQLRITMDPYAGVLLPDIAVTGDTNIGDITMRQAKG